MRDRIFFPLAGLLVVLMIILALQPGIGRLPTGAVAGDGVNYDRIVIEGAYLNKVIAGGDARTRLLRTPERGYVLQIETEAGALQEAPELGPHFRLAPDLEVQFSGRRIRVTVRARPADNRGAMEMQANYSAGRVGESGWRKFALQPGFTDFTFEFEVPVATGEQGVDYFGVRPVVPEKQRAILIEQITLERLP
ncbi:MAG: hypothetical protein ACK4P2_01855 [Hyphomonas sp.]